MVLNDSVELQVSPALGIQPENAHEEPNSIIVRNDQPLNLPPTLLYNRVRPIALHVPWYSFRTQARLARDSGVSPSAVSRLIHGGSQPSLAVALRITSALAGRLGRPLDLFEVFSLNGTFPTTSVCRLTGCPDCLPPEAYDDHENLRPEFQGVRAGDWSLTIGARPHSELAALAGKGGR